MQLAFYAPMKPPDDPVPSGDRTMAQSVMSALDLAGFDPVLASHFRSRDPSGDTHRQANTLRAANIEKRKILSQKCSKSWKLWLTYHNYYKAPDLIGPAVAEDLGIPYVLIEATRARKRFGGPWDAYARAAEAATDAADCIFYLTQHDAEALRTYKTPAQNLVHLAPFLNRQTLPDKSPSSPHIICVGMFRAGDKMNSYTLIADTLQRLKTRDWHLSIIGDGPERAAVSDLMSPFGSRVSMLGALPPEDVLKAYQSAGILLWPGVNEAFGMIYLEAQAAGLAVVAQDRPGVRDVLAPGLPYPTEKDGPQALADRLEHLIASRTLRQNAGQTARQYVAKHHLLGNAADRLRTTLAGLTT